MNQTLIQTAAVAGIAFCTSPPSIDAESADQAQKQPNIILFLVDDMGWQDTSVPMWKQKTPLNERYVTPGMERLAARGMKFTNAYACPICSPSRVSLMTGMNAARHRVTTWTLNYGKDPVAPPRNTTLNLPHWNVNGITPYPAPEGMKAAPDAVSAVCLPKLLKEAGYYTIHAGKAHLGSRGGPSDILTAQNPLSAGFDVNIAGSAVGGPGSYMPPYGKGGNFWVSGLEEFTGTKTHLTRAVTQKALQAMDSAVMRDQPFFLYLAHYAVHAPFQPDPEFIGLWQNRGLPGKEPEYASMVQGMDESLCQVLDRLDKLGIADNTIVMFMSDNGGYALSGRSTPAQVQNAPASAGKGAIYEGGLRVPMIVSWPGVTDSARSCETPVIIEDFFPSVLEMANARYTVQQLAPGQVIDGKSFVPMVKGKKGDTERPLFFHFPNNWGEARDVPGYGTFSGAVAGGWKYIFYHEQDTRQIGAKVREELFYIPEDIGEKKNLARVNPAKLKQMRQLLSNHLRETQAQMPTRRSDGKVIPYPDEI